MRTAVPLVVIGVLALAGWRLRSRGRMSAANEKKAGALSDALFGWGFFLVFLLYPGCCFTAFSTFTCSTLDDGSSYLRRDPSIDCNDPFHSAMKGYAAIMIVICALPTHRIPSNLSVHALAQPSLTWTVRCQGRLACRASVPRPRTEHATPCRLALD